MMAEEKTFVSAIVLAGGRGSRMKSDVPKQYLELNGKPLLHYALEAFQRSPVNEIVVVTGAGEEAFCRQQIIEPGGFDKVRAVVAGGAERYHSVYEGLNAISGSGLVLIHDGARPCVTEEIIGVAIEGARQYGACAVGMPVKDTIKVAGADGFAQATPDRSRLWMIQTPQAFSCELIQEAYRRLFAAGTGRKGVTDDAMVVETMTETRVKLVAGSYENIKVTTPEDLAVAEMFLKNRRQGKYERHAECDR